MNANIKSEDNEHSLYTHAYVHTGFRKSRLTVVQMENNNTGKVFYILTFLPHSGFLELTSAIVILKIVKHMHAYKS